MQKWILHVTVVACLLGWPDDAHADIFAAPLPAKVTIYRAPCPSAEQSDTCSNPDTAEVWHPSRDRFALAHEIGHVYLEQLDGYWKGRLMILLAFDPVEDSWQPLIPLAGTDLLTEATGADCIGRKCPSEIAADAYAACALRMHPGGRRRGRRLVGGWESAYGYEPTRRQHRRVCRVIRASDRG